MTEARIYVGTYGAYNNGSLHGAWLDLSDYSDIEEFWEAVNLLHAAEIAATGEIEPMFQDWEGIPERFIGESSLDPQVWELWVDLDDDDKEMLEIYLDNVNQGGTFEQAQEAFSGKHDSPEDWAEEFLNDCSDLKEIPEHLRYYFDFKAYARDVEMGGDMSFVRHEGYTWAFNNNC